MNEPSQDPMLARVLGERYRIDAIIAHGGMASVYRATDLRLERTVALKVIHQHLAQDQSFRSKFLREAKIAARLNHGNLVNVFDQGEIGNQIYLVMEYVPGITLRDALQDFGALPPDRALEVFESVLAGLAAAHRAGVLHRDLKPENVLLADDGGIKLGDFGLARDIDQRTQTGALIGTVAYLSPELLTQGAADARSDVYATGIMLFELLTGEQPFVGEQAVQVAYQHANEFVPAPSQKKPELPELLDEIVLWATERNPEHRPIDASELLAVVKRARKELAASPQLASRGSRQLTEQIADWREEARPSSFAAADAAATTLLGTAATAASGNAADTEDLGFVGATQQNVTERIEDLSDRNDGITPLEWLDRRMRMRNRLLALGLVVSLLLAGGAGWWFGAGPGGLVAIPELSGRSLSDARAALEPYELAVSVAEEYSPEVAADLVSRTEPAAGDSVLRGSAITIFVSLGPELKALSSLKGLGLAAATEQLQAAGFALGQVTELFDAIAAPGAVIAHDGDEGQPLPVGQAVDLVISMGAIPNVLGLSEALARDALTNAGLTVDRVTQNFSDSVPEGNVIRLVPLVEPLPKGGGVRLVISKGPEQVIMPAVIGETIAAAKLALETLGLKVLVNTNQLQSSWGIVKVTGASANAGQTLRVGDTVTISSN